MCLGQRFSRDETLPTEGVGWKEAIAVVSGRPQRQQRREGPWNASRAESRRLGASALQSLAAHCARRFFGRRQRRDEATHAFEIEELSHAMHCWLETVQDSALASLGRTVQRSEQAP